MHVVGGGVTGLTAGLRVAQQGMRVVVHERDPHLGGLASESQLAGVPVEHFYHCVLPTDDRLLALFDEIGLDDSAIGWARTRTGFFDGTKIHELTTTADFLRFAPIGFVDRLRLGWTVLYCGLSRDGRRFGHEPVGQFLRRHGGDRLFRRIWEPLLVSKLGPDYDRFAASFIWGTIRRMLSARRSRGRAEQLGFVRGRYGRVFTELRGGIEKLGGSVLAGVELAGLERRDGGGWTLHFDSGPVDASSVILCTPAPVTGRLLAGAGLQSMAERFETVDHLGVICESLLLRRPLTPFYILNLIGGGLPFTGVIETSNLTGRDEFAGNALVYLPRYRSRGHSDWVRDDADLHRENFAGLKSVVPDLTDEDVVAWTVRRASCVQPVYGPDGKNSVPPVDIAPGLSALCSAHVHPLPVFNDESVRNVERHFPELMRSISSGSLQPDAR